MECIYLYIISDQNDKPIDLPSTRRGILFILVEKRSIDILPSTDLKISEEIMELFNENNKYDIILI